MMYNAALLVALDMVLSVLGAVEIPATHAPSRTKLVVEDYGLSVSVHVWCDSAPLDLPHEPLAAPPAGHSWRSVKSVVLRGCGPPLSDPPTLSHALAARGLSPTIVDKLELREAPPGAIFNASHFAGLDSLKDLTVQATGTDRPQHLADDLMLSLANVTRLSLENEALPPLSEQSQVYHVTLEHGRSLGAWGGCRALYILHLRDWIVPVGGWLEHCNQLRYLIANGMSFESLQATLLGLSANSSMLTTLDLTENALTTPNLLAVLQQSATGVVNLRVSYNNLTHIDSVLDAQTSLYFLDLSYNMLSDLERTLRALEKQQHLRRLLLSFNPLRKHCTGPVLHNLKELSLIDTGVVKLCFSEWTDLRILDLDGNHIEDLQFGQLPWKHNKSMTVYLRRNPLRKLSLSESDYNAMKDASKMRTFRQALVTVYTDSLPLFHCNTITWLARALQEGFVVISGIVSCYGSWTLQDAASQAVQSEVGMQNVTITIE